MPQNIFLHTNMNSLKLDDSIVSDLLCFKMVEYFLHNRVGHVHINPHELPGCNDSTLPWKAPSASRMGWLKIKMSTSFDGKVTFFHNFCLSILPTCAHTIA